MTVFDNEEGDMHSTFEELMGDVLDDKFASYLFHEVRVGSGRADFAIAHVDLDRAWERIATYGNAEGLPRDCRDAYFTAENHCPAPKSELVDRCKHPEPGASERAVDWLIDNNYLLEDSDGWYRFHRPISVLSSVEVCELKLDNWEKGIRQAQNYRKTIGESGYVVVDADHKSAAEKNLEEFKKNGVGLMAIDRESVDVLHKPSPRPTRDIDDTDRTRLSELAFKRFTDEHPQRDPRRRLADKIGQHQNPLKANHVATTLDDVRE